MPHSPQNMAFWRHFTHPNIQAKERKSNKTKADTNAAFSKRAAHPLNLA